MQVNFKKLQGVVKEAIKKEKAARQLMREAVEYFGPAVDLSKDPMRVFEAVNDQLTVMESRGEDLPVGVLKTSTLLMASSSGKEARKLAARLLPEKYAVKFLSDKDSSVRCAAANRFSYSQLTEALKKFPSDDALFVIASKKLICEDGVPTPPADDEHFDLYGDGPLGEMLDGYEPEDLTDGWYKRTALKIYNDHKGRFDGNWKFLAVSRLCSSIHATSGVKIDSLKLREILDKICENYGVLMDEGISLLDLKEKLLMESRLEEEISFPVLDESFFDNEIKVLLSESKSNYINKANELFEITHEVIEESLIAGDTQAVKAPKYGKLPKNYIWDSNVEKSLDTYTSLWNGRAKARGSNAKLAWSCGFNNRINFNLLDK